MKIRGLCRNKQAQQPATSLSESSAMHYSSGETTDKIYDQHTDRIGNSAIIKESPVIVTSPQHPSNQHKPSSSSSSSSSSTSSVATAAIASGLCPDSDLSKRVSFAVSYERIRFDN